MAYIGPEPNPGQNREVDDISSGFNGSTASFTLQVNGQNVSPGSANAIIVSLGGVVQNPGTDYTVSASTITFTTNPASGLSFFGLVLGQGVDTSQPADGSVSTAKIADQAVTLAKLPHGTGSNDGKFLRANNGADPTFETVTGTTINNNADNRVITGSGTANTLNAESNVFIESNGRLGVGTSTPTHLFTVVDGSTSIGFSRSGNNPQIVLDANNLSNAGLIQVDESSGGSLFTFSTKTTGGTLQPNFRINMAGDVTTTNDVTYDRATSGFTARKGDSVNSARQHGFPLEINRTGSDGGLINFFQNGSSEGNISVSGSSVSYNGGHLSRWSQLKGLSQTDKSARPTIYQGTVMSNLDDLCVWHHADEFYDKGDELNQSIPEGKKIGDVKTPAYDEVNQQLNMTKISDTEGDKDAAGVFWAWDDDDDEIVNDFYIAMTGDLVIRVAESTTVARGDLLISAGDGTAKPQDDDIVRSSTIAKIISTNHTATYPDGSKAYPCVLMAC